MNTRNTCKTSFKIVGEFNPDEISALLQITPEKSWKIGDLRRDGTAYDFALWEAGTCDEYDVEVENQMQKTISVLRDKIHLLKQIQTQYGVRFYLSVVPSIYVGESNPCLAPSLAVMDFCHETRTEMDIDLYVYDSTEA